MISLINPIWGHILNLIPKNERVKRGRADILLTYMLVSELIVGNLIMAILTFITKRKLSQSSKQQGLTIYERTTAIILLVFSVFSGFILLRLTLVML